MRFAYIDSQGNEVPIPSIDALALRIELGAVGPDTQLYDAQADHWGPARTHEIFHSLSRDSEDEGFMAPPPPVAGAEEAASKTPAVTGRDTAAAPVEELAPEPEEEEEGEVDLGLTLADPLPEPEAPTQTSADDSMDMPLISDAPDELPLLEDPEPEPSLELGEDEMDFAVEGAEAAESTDGGSEDASDELPLLEEPAAESDGGGFDFGDLGAGLELEEADAPESGMALETEMEFQSPGAADFDSSGDSLDLEQPMSAFEPESPPGWMEEPDTDDVMDFSAVAAEEEAAPVEPAVAEDARAAPHTQDPAVPAEVQEAAFDVGSHRVRRLRPGCRCGWLLRLADHPGESGVRGSAGAACGGAAADPRRPDAADALARRVRDRGGGAGRSTANTTTAGTPAGPG